MSSMITVGVGTALDILMIVFLIMNLVLNSIQSIMVNKQVNDLKAEVKVLKYRVNNIDTYLNEIEKANNDATLSASIEKMRRESARGKSKELSERLKADLSTIYGKDQELQ